ncbi:beta-ketoacyl-ACP synthase 3 [Paracoccus sp. DMF]|uniref:beta-ketoacyl-ACP synthase 3 n=1 Tax=Paracoccus sp. DMF TaxID=400837 RepID=UPI0021E4F354|nr:beta-ketoacyl-ACP synthase 3 [Paracoccus sp. DMF]MCV2446139.1 beta-ketoacyl-ACP synthase 3 [Paracoccus sp. DMF]
MSLGDAARGVVMAGFGHYLPERRVDNAEIEADLNLPPGWIAARTGIHSRHYAAPEQAVSDLAVPAGRMALEQAGVAAGSIGLLLLATSTPDHLLPPTAPLVAHRLGLGAGAMDLAGACAGFLQALVLGAGHVRATGQAVLVIAANILSRRIAPDDIATRALFADAAGAVVLAASPDPAKGLRASVLRSDGAGYDLIRIAKGGSRQPFRPGDAGLAMDMADGRAVFTRAVEGMTTSSQAALREAGLTAAGISTWLAHQANGRILAQVGARLGLDRAECLGTLARHGNSSAATMPLALSCRAAEGPLPTGPMLMTAFGAGLLWGSVVWQP